MKKLIFILFSLILSCKSPQTLSESNVMNCVRNKINKEEFGLKYDIYDKLYSFENYLLSEKILTNKNRDSYISLFENFNSNDKLKNQDNDIRMYLKEFSFPIYSFAPYMLLDCPEEVISSAILNKEKYDKTLLIFYLINEKFPNVGYGNSDNILTLLSLMDDKSFQKNVYRMPIVLLFLIKYEEEILSNNNEMN